MMNPSDHGVAGLYLCADVQLVWGQQLDKVFKGHKHKLFFDADTCKVVLNVVPAPEFQLIEVVLSPKHQSAQDIFRADLHLEARRGNFNNVLATKIVGISQQVEQVIKIQTNFPLEMI